MLISDARQAADLLGPLVRGRPGEALAVAHLDADGRLLALMQRDGAAAFVDLPLRDIIAEGLRTDARALVVAHYHPGGDPQPSLADIRATRRLAELTGALGLRVYDHLIFTGDRCASMRAMGLL